MRNKSIVVKLFIVGFGLAIGFCSGGCSDANTFPTNRDLKEAEKRGHDHINAVVNDQTSALSDQHKTLATATATDPEVLQAALERLDSQFNLFKERAEARHNAALDRIEAYKSEAVLLAEKAGVSAEGADLGTLLQFAMATLFGGGLAGIGGSRLGKSRSAGELSGLQAENKTLVQKIEDIKTEIARRDPSLYGLPGAGTATGV